MNSRATTNWILIALLWVAIAWFIYTVAVTHRMESQLKASLREFNQATRSAFPLSPVPEMPMQQGTSIWEQFPHGLQAQIDSLRSQGADTWADAARSYDEYARAMRRLGDNQAADAIEGMARAARIQAETFRRGSNPNAN